MQCRAWVYYQQGHLIEKLEKKIISIDSNLKSDEILVRICAVGLNPVDIQLANLPQWIVNWILFNGENKAKIPAGDFSGVVEKIGNGVTKYRVGDEIFGLNLSIRGHGCLCEYVKLSESLSSMTLKPSSLNHIEAAAMPLVFLTAYTGLYQWGQLKNNDDKVLIIGAAGGVGHVACQLARTTTRSIVGICSTSNVDFVRQLGVDSVIDYSIDDPLEQCRRLAPFDLIFDCVGGQHYLQSDLFKSNRSTYITIVGDKTNRTILGGLTSYFFTPSMIFRTIRSWFGVFPRYYCINLSTTTENTEVMRKMLDEQVVRPVIDSVYRFSDQVCQAYERLDTGRAKGKIVIEFD